MKEYFIFNTEPNVNILGLDPIVRSMWSKEIEELSGRRLKVFAYQIEGGVFNAAANKKEWLEFGSYLFEKISKEHNFPDIIKNQLEKNGFELYDLCRQTLIGLKEDKITDSEMREIILKIFKLFTAICVPGILAPLIEINDNQDNSVSNKIKAILREKQLAAVGLSEPACLALLSIPHETTWTEKVQVVLYEMAQKIYERGEKLDNLLVESENLLKDFVADWGWIYYGYCGPKYTVKNAKDELENIWQSEIEPIKILDKIKNEREEKINKQAEIMSKLEFTEEEKYFVSVAQGFGYTKAYRANLMALSDYTINEMLSIFARQEGYTMKQIGICTVREIEAYLQNKSPLPSVDILNKRLDYAVLISRAEEDVVLIGEEAKKWMLENVEVEEVDLGVTELSGTVACTGENAKVIGTVKVVMDSGENGKVNLGDIMLSTNTVPDHVPAMRRAVAIITEVGGLTCHAAIVSRELNKSCIVGVKHLLKIFKDGDMVEVDADKGVIKKI